MTWRVSKVTYENGETVDREFIGLCDVIQEAANIAHEVTVGLEYDKDAHTGQMIEVIKVEEGQ